MPNCFESGNCPVNSPLDFFSYPFTFFFGDWFYVMVWGVIVGILFLRNKDPMLTSLVGVVIAGFFSGTSVMTSSQTSSAFNIGYILFAISIGFFVWSAINKPPNPAL